MENDACKNELNARITVRNYEINKTVLHRVIEKLKMMNCRKHELNV